MISGGDDLPDYHPCITCKHWIKWEWWGATRCKPWGTNRFPERGCKWWEREPGSDDAIPLGRLPQTVVLVGPRPRPEPWRK